MKLNLKKKKKNFLNKKISNFLLLTQHLTKHIYSSLLKPNEPFNKKIFIWFYSLMFFNVFIKKKGAYNVSYFEYIFLNYSFAENSAFSDLKAGFGWFDPNKSFSARLQSNSLPYPTGDLLSLRDMEDLNRHFIPQSNQDMEVGQTELFLKKQRTTVLNYNQTYIDDFAEDFTLLDIYWIWFFISLMLFFLELILLFVVFFFWLDYFLVFDGYCWNLIYLSNIYPSRFVLATSFIDPFFSWMKILILFFLHFWYLSKLAFCIFVLFFCAFFYLFIRFLLVFIYNCWLAFAGRGAHPIFDGYYDPFFEDASFFFEADFNDYEEDEEEADIDSELNWKEDVFFKKDPENAELDLYFRPLSFFFFLLQTIFLYVIFLTWWICLFFFVIASLSYFFYTVFQFIIFDDDVKYTLFNYIYGHPTFFPILDWFYQFDLKLKRLFNQRFFFEKFGNFVFSKGLAKLKFFFIQNTNYENQQMYNFIKHVNSKNISYFPRRLKSKSLYYNSLTPYLPSLKTFFTTGVTSKRLLLDFVFYKSNFNNFEFEPFICTFDSVNYFAPMRSRLWLVDWRFKDFFSYFSDFFSGSFFFSYLQFNNGRKFFLDDLLFSRLLGFLPVDFELYQNELFCQNNILSVFFDLPSLTFDNLLRSNNLNSTVSDIFLEDFISNLKPSLPEIFFSNNFLFEYSFVFLNRSFYSFLFNFLDLSRFFQSSFYNEHFNNLFSLNFKFEELFESVEHHTDLFFDISKRSYHSNDIETYLNAFWLQYIYLKDANLTKQMFLSQHKLDLIKINSKVLTYITENLKYVNYNKKDFYERFLLFYTKTSKVKFNVFTHFDKFFNFYSPKQFVELNSKLAHSFLKFKYVESFGKKHSANTVIETNRTPFGSFYRNYLGFFKKKRIKFDSVLNSRSDKVWGDFAYSKVKYFRNLELWRIPKFQTNFQLLCNKLNSRTFINYYAFSPSTLPKSKYRDHLYTGMLKIHLNLTPREEFSWGFSDVENYVQEAGPYINYTFNFENDLWRNYQYTFSQKFFERSPKFIASSSFFYSYPFIVKYLPLSTFRSNNQKLSSYFWTFNASFFQFFFVQVLNFFAFLISNFTYLFFIWNSLFFLFIIRLYFYFLEETPFFFSKSNVNIYHFFKDYKNLSFTFFFFRTFFISIVFVSLFSILSLKLFMPSFSIIFKYLLNINLINFHDVFNLYNMFDLLLFKNLSGNLVLFFFFVISYVFLFFFLVVLLFSNVYNVVYLKTKIKFYYYYYFDFLFSSVKLNAILHNFSFKSNLHSKDLKNDFFIFFLKQMSFFKITKIIIKKKK